MGDIVARGMAAGAASDINEAKTPEVSLKAKLEALIVAGGGVVIDDDTPSPTKTYSSEKIESLAGSVQAFKGWGYQDFNAGVITGTSVTISANSNGDGITFDASKIINNTACIVLASDGDKVPYSGALKLFSTRVQANSNTAASVTLNAVPHASYGTLRIYYYYNYSAGIPENYSIAPKSVGGNLFAELDSNFATDEELTTGLQGKANSEDLPTALSELSDDETHRLVADAEKTTWNAKSELALGESVETAYRGDRGKTAYDHSQADHAPADANNYTHPVTHSADIIEDGTTNKAYTATEKTKLAGMPTIWIGTQAEYDAIGSKDAATLYFIKT